MTTLTAEFSAAFSRDLKKKAKRRNWNLTELQKLIDLVLQNTPESIDILKRRHNMHRLSGNWAGRNECHVANSGNWLVIWSSNDEVAFFERTAAMMNCFDEHLSPKAPSSRMTQDPLSYPDIVATRMQSADF